MKYKTKSLIEKNIKNYLEQNTDPEITIKSKILKVKLTSSIFPNTPTTLHRTHTPLHPVVTFPLLYMSKPTKSITTFSKRVHSNPP